MRRSRLVVFAAVAFAFVAAGAACGLQDGGEGIAVNDSRDGSGSPDALIDGTIVDGTSPGDGSNPPGDGGAIDGSGLDSSPPADAGTPYFCGPKAVGNCATDCPGFPVSCGPVCFAGCGACPGANFECDSCFSDGGRSFSACEPQDAAAYSACLVGQTRCPCTDQGNCPGPNQTCEGMMCFECGEVDAGNSGDICKTGSGGHMCKTDQTHYGECF
ncbi:MAG: hypothetical protein ABI183_24845 [Polyangiaceae bacterium]